MTSAEMPQDSDPLPPKKDLSYEEIQQNALLSIQALKDVSAVIARSVVTKPKDMTDSDYYEAVRLRYATILSSVTAWKLDAIGRPTKEALAMLESFQDGASQLVEDQFNRLKSARNQIQKTPHRLRGLGNFVMKKLHDIIPDDSTPDKE